MALLSPECGSGSDSSAAAIMVDLVWIHGVVVCETLISRTKQGGVPAHESGAEATPTAGGRVTTGREGVSEAVVEVLAVLKKIFRSTFGGWTTAEQF